MKMVNYKNVATGLAESVEVGSRGDRKRRADPKRYICMNPGVLPKPKEAKVEEVKPSDAPATGKK